MKPSHVDTLVAGMTAGGFAPGTVRKAIGTARSMFAAAHRDELIDRNPAAKPKQPPKSDHTKDVFTRDELRAIVDASRHFAAGGVIAFLAGTGCRIGEGVALDVADYDRTAGTVSITKTYNPKFGVGPPKSKYSKRTIPVPAALRSILDEAVKGRKAGPLFPTKGGKMWRPRAVGEAFKTLLKRAGLSYKSPHAMRHTVATILVAAGEPLADVAKYLGDRVETVVRFYVHATGKMPIATLDSVFDVR